MTWPDARTRVAGVVGYPVAHSLSPALHNAALRQDGVNAVYLAFAVEPEGFAAFVDGLRAGGARGLNVTVPHKTAAFEGADRLSETAERAGAVNTLLFEDAAVIGHNTDVEGIRAALRELEIEVEGARALVIGAGGAGAAACWALREAAEVSIANRTPPRAEDLAARLGNSRVVPWDGLPAAAATADLIVQATSVGLDGEGSVLDAATCAAAAEAGCRGLLDLVYAPEETPVVRCAREAGLRAADGLGVLVHQAAGSYELFWQRPADRALMHATAAAATGRPHA